MDAGSRPLSRRHIVQGVVAAAGSLAVAACGSDADTRDPSEPEPTPSSDAPTTPSGGRPSVLVVFFSRAGENYYYGDRVDLEVGNTAVVAGFVADAVDCDVYEIVAADPYPEAYEPTVERNTREQDADARPGIAGELPDLSGYDTVLLGSGIWNVRPPMIMETFVESVDLSGTTVHPFVTYAVSGMGSTESVYRDALPDSTIGEGLAVLGEEAAESAADVRNWLDRIGLAS